MTVTEGSDCVDQIRVALDRRLSGAHANENRGQTANAKFHGILPESESIPDATAKGQSVDFGRDYISWLVSRDG
jgi:hypothetical protein